MEELGRNLVRRRNGVSQTARFAKGRERASYICFHERDHHRHWKLLALWLTRLQIKLADASSDCMRPAKVYLRSVRPTNVNEDDSSSA